MDVSQLQGVDNFIKRCDSIERRVPNLSSVMHWVQEPETIFKQVVAKAQSDTGISLSGGKDGQGLLALAQQAQQQTGGQGLLSGALDEMTGGDEPPVASDAE